MSYSNRGLPSNNQRDNNRKLHNTYIGDRSGNRVVEAMMLEEMGGNGLSGAGFRRLQDQGVVYREPQVRYASGKPSAQEQYYQALLKQAEDERFWNNNQKFAETFGRGAKQQAGRGLQGRGYQQPRNGKQAQGGLGSYKTYGVDGDAARTAGEFTSLIDAFDQARQSQDSAAGEKAMNDIVAYYNKSPFSKNTTAAGIKVDDSGTWTLFDNMNQPIKQFHPDNLRNLNNYVNETQYQYQPGREVDDPAKYAEGRNAYIQNALNMDAGKGTKNPERESQRLGLQYDQQFGPRAPSWQSNTLPAIGQSREMALGLQTSRGQVPQQGPGGGGNVLDSLGVNEPTLNAPPAPPPVPEPVNDIAVAPAPQQKPWDYLQGRYGIVR